MRRREASMTRLATAALLVLAAGVLAGCGSSSSSSSGSTESGGSSGGGGKKVIAGVQANDHGTKAVEDSGKTEVELDDFYFSHKHNKPIRPGKVVKRKGIA
jgi:hypothetical protein